MPERDASEFAHGGYISVDGIKWTPVSEAEPFGVTKGATGTRVWDADTLLRIKEPETVTLRARKLYVSRKVYCWLRMWLGYKRLDYVWQYRRERKGHPRCR